MQKYKKLSEMKVIEMLKLNKDLLKVFQIAGIRVEDVRYIDLYTDYKTLLDNGEKVCYIVAVLSERYGVSQRKVYALIKHFQTDCNILAV